MIKTKCLRIPFFAGMMIILSSCSGTYRSYTEALSYAFNPPPDVEISLEQVRQSPMDLMYFRYGEQRQAVLALAYIEHGQYKWLSADKALIIMEQGRIVRTVGLKNDLLHVAKTSTDPLQLGIHNLAGSQWFSVVDWENDEYGYVVKSAFSAPKTEQLELFGHTFSVLKVIETLQYEDRSDYWRFDQQWQNEYWFEQNTGQLIKSRQQYAPFQPISESVFISRAVRLIPAGS